jgi:hypothetical protein
MPFSVSNSTKIGSLDADLLDSLDSSAFLRTSGKAADANLLDGIDSTGFYAAGSKVADSELLDGYHPTSSPGPHVGATKTPRVISVHVAGCKRLGLRLRRATQLTARPAISTCVSAL